MANATVGVVTCVACPEGLRCPLGSSLESLKMGDKNFGEAFTPRILEGYFSTEDPCFEWTFSLKNKSLFDVERAYFCGVWNDKWFDVSRDALLRSQAFLQMHIGG